MPRGNRPCRVDANQAEVITALRAAGYYVKALHMVGFGFPDLLVVSKSRRVVLMEIKQRGESLNRDERDFHEVYPGPICIAHSSQEAVDIMAKFDA